MTSTVRSIVRIAVVAVVAGLLVAAPRRAYADDLGVRLSVKRAPEASDCPDATHLAAAIAGGGHRAPPSVAPNGDARLRFEVEMTKSATGYAAIVRILGARIGVRQIEHTGSACAPLGDALAVALVVVIDDVEEGDAADRAAEAAASPPPREPADRSGPPRLPPPPPDIPRERTERVDEPDALLETVPARTAFNSLFVQLGGAGLFYTLNLEHLFGDSDFSLRAGFGYAHLDGDLFKHSFNEEDLSVPVLVNYYIGNGSHKVQLGAGGMLLYQQDDGSTEATTTSINFAAVVGYRYLPADGGVNFGISFTPCFRPDVTLPWFGVDFGVGF